MRCGLVLNSCMRVLLEIKGEVTMKRGEKCSIKSERKARAATVLEMFFKLLECVHVLVCLLVVHRSLKYLIESLRADIWMKLSGDICVPSLCLTVRWRTVCLHVFFNPHVDLFPSKVNPPEKERCLQSRCDRSWYYHTATTTMNPSDKTTCSLHTFWCTCWLRVSYCDTNNVTYGCYSVKVLKLQ